MSARKTLTVEHLVKRLPVHDAHQVLGVAAQLVLMLGSGLDTMWVSYLLDHDDPAGPWRDAWDSGNDGAPWLNGYLTPLTSWAEHHPHPGQVIKQVAYAFRDLDVKAMLRQDPYDGDLLGPLYTALMSKSGQRAKGAFYTPMALSRMMAMMSGIADGEDGQSVCDPCCGAGGMIVAAAQVLKLGGKNPGNYLWVANDTDPLAVALAGVNMTVHGCGPHIWLSVGDGLTLDTGHDTDPHRTQRPWWEAATTVDVDELAIDMVHASPPFMTDPINDLLGAIDHAISLGNRSRRTNTHLAPPGEGGAP